MPVLTPQVKKDKSFHRKESQTQQHGINTTAKVQLQSVTKTYTNGTHSLLNANLEVKKGEFLFITGPSGSGKSTLLKLRYGQ